MKTLVVLDETLIRALLDCIERDEVKNEQWVDTPELDEAERQLKTSLQILAQAKGAVSKLGS
jgi:hypothetical protein